MEVKKFEYRFPFIEHHKTDGTVLLLPLVEVTFGIENSKMTHRLMFDTGALNTIFWSKYFTAFGLNSWNEGEEITVFGVGGFQEGFKYDVTLEILGKAVNCPIILLEVMKPPSLYAGVLGRDTILDGFGFGFWEYSKELFITDNPEL